MLSNREMHSPSRSRFSFTNNVYAIEAVLTVIGFVSLHTAYLHARHSYCYRNPQIEVMRA